MEKESDDRELPFLDIQLRREEDGTISMSVYRRKIHTNQYLYFFLHHPVSHKKQWADMKYRLAKTCIICVRSCAMHMQTDKCIHIYTNIAESQIDCDY